MVNVVESDQLRWIVALPLLAAACHGVMLGLVRRPTPRWLIIGLSCGSVLASFVVTCVAFGELIQLPGVSNLFAHIQGPQFNRAYRVFHTPCVKYIMFITSN